MEESNTNSPDQAQSFKCLQCSAKLTFSAGASSLKCLYCNYENPIPRSEEDIHELDYHAFLQQASENEPTEECLTVECNECGAQLKTEADVTSGECPYCGVDMVMTTLSKKLIKPKALLPFKITGKEALASYRSWCDRLWFAPNALKKKAKIDGGINGIYAPCWTYDTNSSSYYTGRRGEYYYVTERRTSTDSEGKRTTKNVRVRKTRWYFTSGVVCLAFNDVLVMASRSLPENYARQLEPWDLENLKAYQDEYVSGFRTESYQVDLEEGFEAGKEIMDDAIRRAVKQDIGGDTQRISTVKTEHSNITFKHILLPLWLSVYRYNGSTYRFMVNARTGEVQGERPWSPAKITALITAVASIIGVFALYYE
ncbi:MAG: hypothetical protein OEV42_14955 [Deltaproteobacteria bacterium]|nr:hypothetical protein [Deltaproteobacteria bacterium]